MYKKFFLIIISGLITSQISAMELGNSVEQMGKSTKPEAKQENNKKKRLLIEDEDLIDQEWHSGMNLSDLFCKVTKISNEINKESDQSIDLNKESYNLMARLDVKMIEQYLNAGHKISDLKEDKDGTTIFILAVRYCTNVEVIKVLLEKGASVHEKNNRGTTPLIYAAGYNTNRDVIQLLLEKGASVHEKNNRGTTPLIYAAGYNANVEVIQLLLEKGGTVHEKNNRGTTPLIYAAGCNTNVEVIQLLLENDANVHEKNKFQLTPLEVAILNNNANVEVVELLLAKGADIKGKNRDGKTLLMLALSNNANVEIVQLLLANGADVNETNRDGATPLMLAVSNNANVEVVQLLLASGADVNKKNKAGETPVMYAVMNNANVEIVQLLLVKGANVNEENRTGTIPLMYAVSNSENLDVIKLLLENANPDESITNYLLDVYFERLFNLALNENHLDLFAYLLQVKSAAKYLSGDSIFFDNTCLDKLYGNLVMFRIFIANYPVNWRKILEIPLKNPKKVDDDDNVKSLQDMIWSEIGEKLFCKHGEKKIEFIEKTKYEKNEKYQHYVSMLFEEIYKKYLAYIVETLPLKEKLANDRVPEDVKEVISLLMESHLVNDLDLNSLIQDRIESSLIDRLAYERE